MDGTHGLRPGALRVDVERATDGSWVLAVVGELDRFTVPRLDEALGPLAAGDGGDATVVLDMTDCSFVDSSGLSALVSAHGILGASGRRLELVAPPPLLRLLRSTGLDGLLAIRTSPADGVPRGLAEAPAEP